MKLARRDIAAGANPPYGEIPATQFLRSST